MSPTLLTPIGNSNWFLKQFNLIRVKDAQKRLWNILQDNSPLSPRLLWWCFVFSLIEISTSSLSFASFLMTKQPGINVRRFSFPARTFRGFVGENVCLVALLDVLEKINDNDGIKFILALRDLFAILNCGSRMIQMSLSSGSGFK